MISLNKTYSLLLARYGIQGWWPILNRKTLSCQYQAVMPSRDEEFFEIALGAILTQNIAWKNVEKALGQLASGKLLKAKTLHGLSAQEIAPYIRPTGYFNQKAIKIKNFLDWYAAQKFSLKKISGREPEILRNELLSIKGVGPETADSMLLYGLGHKIFVVDAYTKRIFTRLGHFDGNEDYQAMQGFFHKKFKGDARDYNEFHALIVVHGKDICKNKPLCRDCCLAQHCASKNNFHGDGT